MCSLIGLDFINRRVKNPQKSKRKLNFWKIAINAIAVALIFVAGWLWCFI